MKNKKFSVLMTALFIASSPFSLRICEAGYWDSYNQGVTAGSQMGDSILDAPLRRQQQQLELQRQQLENERLRLELNQERERAEREQNIRDDQKAMNEVVSMIVKSYPCLDSNSPNKNMKLINQIIKKRNELINEGSPPPDALLKAVIEVRPECN